MIDPIIPWLAAALGLDAILIGFAVIAAAVIITFFHERIDDAGE